MIAASVWSLLIPSVEMTKYPGAAKIIPCVLGFVLGIMCFMLCDALLTRKAKSEGCEPDSTVLPCIAVAVHNLPEGMAVGALFAEAYILGSAEAFAAASALSIGIAVQNLPEGAIISMPLYASGTNKAKAFLIGILSGVVEPIGAYLTILAAEIAVPALPYLLSFAAGAMVYAVLDSFSEKYQGRERNIRILFFGLGFSLMMSLDILLG